MPTISIYFSQDEDEKIIKFSRKWKIAKYQTVKEIIKRFEENKNE